jgi:hypothetical protein
MAIGPLVIMFVLMIIAFTCGVRAIFKDKDRSPVLVVVMILMCPQLAFWIFMIIGETVSAIFSLH